MLGCGALDASTPVAQSSSGLVATPAVVDFGSVPVGTTAVRTSTVSNTSRSPIVITQTQTGTSAFTVTGQKLPLTLAPGQRTVLQIAYSPQSGGTSESRVVLASNQVRLSTTFALRGTAIMGGRLNLNPTSISFGNVPMGQTQTQSATLSNPGRAPITVTSIVASGKGFSLAAQNLPLTLPAGGSTNIGVNFTPAATGASSGTVSVIARVSANLPKRPITFGGRGRETQVAFNSFNSVSGVTVATVVSVSLSGSGMGAGQLAVLPTSLALGSVKIGASQTQSATLINSGSSNLTVRQATVTGKGFRMSGLSFPLTLAAGQRKSFTVTFAPQSAGSASGSIAVTTDAANPVVSVPVSAVATAPGALISNPSSLGFGSVQVGNGQTLSAALTNSGGSSVTVSQASVSGSGFAISGLNLPMTLAAGQSAAFSVTFNPQSGGAASGTVSFASDASNGTLAVPAHRQRSDGRHPDLNPVQPELRHRTGGNASDPFGDADQLRRLQPHHHPGQSVRRGLYHDRPDPARGAGGGPEHDFQCHLHALSKRRGQWKSGHRQQRFQLQPEHSADRQCRHPWRTEHQRFQSQFWQRSRSTAPPARRRL